MFRRLGDWCYRHRWTVVILWVVGLFVLGGIQGVVGTDTRDEFALPDVESRRGFDILDEHFATRAPAARAARSSSARSKASTTPRSSRR